MYMHASYRNLQKYEHEGVVSFLGKKIVYHNNNDSIEKIKSSLGIKDDLIAKILLNRSNNQDINSIKSQWLSLTIKDSMPNPSTLLGLDHAVNHIYNEISSNNKLLLVADYDVDGATSSALLYNYISHYTNNIDCRIPDRYLEGYGINVAIVRDAIANGVSTIITLDNGINATNAIDFAIENNISVVIIDHHEPISTINSNALIVNPKQHNDTSGLDYLAAVGVTFFVAVGLQRKFRECNYKNSNTINLFDYLDLVAVGTICDMVPIEGFNRAIVKQGLRVLRSSINPGLLSMIKSACRPEDLSIYNISFNVGPVLNSGSRMGFSNYAFKLLTAKAQEDANMICHKLNSLNQLRKEEEHKALNAISAEIKEISSNDGVIFTGSSKYIAGVIGIIAGNIKDTQNKTTFIYSIDPDGETATTSGRSTDDFDISEFISLAKKQNLIIKGGGHARAGGFTFYLNKKNQLLDLANKFIANNASLSTIEKSSNCIKVDDILDLESINNLMAAKIESIGPFGMSFPSPIIIISQVTILDYKLIGKLKNHMKLTVHSKDLSYQDIMFFKSSHNKMSHFIKKNTNITLDIVASVDINKYLGNIRCNLSLIDFII